MTHEERVRYAMEAAYAKRMGQKTPQERLADSAPILRAALAILADRGDVLQQHPELWVTAHAALDYAAGRTPLEQLPPYLVAKAAGR